MKDNYYFYYMAHKTAEELQAMLNDAKAQVKVGGTYFHYKHPDQYYTLVDVVVIEATDEPGVLYRAEYAPLTDITFLRPLADFLATVDVDGIMTARFTVIDSE